MKKIFQYIAFALVLGTTSCESFLDREPRGTISNADMFKDVDGVNYATIGIYSAFVNPAYYSGLLIPYSEFRSGNIKLSASHTLAMVNKISPSFEFRNLDEDDDDKVSDIYATLYELIHQCNDVVEAVQTHEYSTDALAKRCMGEALFMRATAHFDLCRIFAQPYSYSPLGAHRGIVLMTKNMDAFTQVAPSKVNEVYDKVIADLQKADTLLQNNSRTSGIKAGWVSSDAARAMLARIFLYKGDWTNAAKYAGLVINAGYTLVPNAEFVNSWKATTTNSEDILVGDLSVNQSNQLANYYGSVDTTVKAVYGSVSRDLINLYDPTDARLGLIIPFKGNINDSVTLKFSAKLLVERYVPIIRLAEMYLTRAEASAESGDVIQARSDLNFIRKRANPAAANITLSGQALKDEIMVERRRELAFEGHTYYDFIRKGKGITRTDCNALVNKSVPFPSDLLIVPFPKKAVEANPLLNQ
jgi:hypothetical protein